MDPDGFPTYDPVNYHNLDPDGNENENEDEDKSQILAGAIDVSGCSSRDDEHASSIVETLTQLDLVEDQLDEDDDLDEDYILNLSSNGISRGIAQFEMTNSLLSCFEKFLDLDWGYIISLSPSGMMVLEPSIEFKPRFTKLFDVFGMYRVEVSSYPHAEEHLQRVDTRLGKIPLNTSDQRYLAMIQMRRVAYAFSSERQFFLRRDGDPGGPYEHIFTTEIECGIFTDNTS